MSVFHAILLGIIQGLTEFLPISSSAHLVIIPWLLHWKEHSLSFDVTLHAGTLLALFVYSREDWRELLSGTLSDWRHGRLFKDQCSRTVGLILIASIPGGIANMLESKVEKMLREAFVGIAART